MREVKLVCFVRDFQQGEPRKELRLFTTRPKLEGLWLRMHFRDGDAMDGILSNNLLQLDALRFFGGAARSGVPEPAHLRSQGGACRAIQVLGVVGSPLRAAAQTKGGAERADRAVQEE